LAGSSAAQHTDRNGTGELSGEGGPQSGTIPQRLAEDVGYVGHFRRRRSVVGPYQAQQLAVGDLLIGDRQANVQLLAGGAYQGQWPYHRAGRLLKQLHEPRHETAYRLVVRHDKISFASRADHCEPREVRHRTPPSFANPPRSNVFPHNSSGRCAR
jgi:hypothetical protein